jgi:hypothetical protein
MPPWFAHALLERPSMPYLFLLSEVCDSATILQMQLRGTERDFPLLAGKVSKIQSLVALNQIPLTKSPWEYHLHLCLSFHIPKQGLKVGAISQVVVKMKLLNTYEEF